MLKVGYGQADITPPGPTPLAGYFSERISTGVLDPLHARAVVLDDGKKRCALIILDLVGVTAEQTSRVRAHVAAETGLEPDAIFVAATHTHTGPALVPLFEMEPTVDYVPQTLIPGIAAACKNALTDLGPFTLNFGKTVEQGLAFNRRYWMKDGTVVTNPPKGSPDVLKPEGPIDHDVQVLSFVREGKPLLVLADINNHCDTVGGTMISAGWPCFMAAGVKEGLGAGADVVLLNGPAGNINHLDRDYQESQTCYDEATRIGNGYAGFVLKALEAAQPVAADDLSFGASRFSVPYRSVPEEQLQEAGRIAQGEPPQVEGDVTSENLAAGDPYMDWIYARVLLGFVSKYKGHADETVEINAFRIGPCAVVGLPGEPFSHIGMSIKEGSPSANTCLFQLCGDLAGYIPTPECFARGGYEPRTTLKNRFAPEAADIFIAKSLELLRGL